MNYENLVEQCKSLRAAFEQDEARFFLELVQIEANFMPLLIENGCVTFANFLKSHQLCESSRFEGFKKGVAVVGHEIAAKIGVKATMTAAQCRTEEGGRKYTAGALAFVELKGVAPSQQAAQNIREKVEPQARTPNVVKASDELHRLRAENANLRADLAAEKATTKRLGEMVRQQGETIAELKGAAA